ncbi:DUF1444 family protein [Formosa algae]|uniref:Uncharacterized protein YtpQ (UPF0354 family) n=1 Tax=Formosa algae TaxID=225843 RepID=A0A9X0YMB3_9FLAO|nr:DUF1444 family protein [Formosa algae]MBP1840568.1 uncharacterized protein YtpQ (UPF0354 family) [Formosa algae]MDQ0336019.1 uncharacterized protein YtpQ (UPF0354 family) [Formosa algae]
MSNTIYGPEKTPEEIAKIVEQTENSDKKIYPILKPGNWVGLKAGALSSTLIPSEDGAEVVIAYGMDTPDNFVFLNKQHLETMDAKQITQEAFTNLENYDTDFEFVKALHNKALASSGNDFSSERLLSQAHMLKAHTMLEADELLVSVPRRTCMMVISKTADEDTINKFIYLHNHTWEDDSYGNAPITNALFVVKEGSIVGHIPL